MKEFAALISALDGTTKSSLKLKALVEYLGKASDRDKLWTLALLTGKRPKRPVKTALLRTWATEIAEIPQWLFEESYFVVGDLAETIALLLPHPKGENNYSLNDRMEQLIAIREADDEEAKKFVFNAWNEMGKVERFVFNKLITGGFRIGVSQKTMVKALASHLGKEEAHIAHRIMGSWSPQETSFQSLLVDEDGADNLSRPYPFCLAYPLTEPPEELGSVTDWQIEHKWDGIRGQFIKRKGEVFVWSRGEELVTHQFPEFSAMADEIPRDCVIDGEIIAYDEKGPLTFNHLQKRLGRKTVGKKIMADSPVKLIAYDLLEMEAEDLREEPMTVRRERLEEIVSDASSPTLLISQNLKPKTWEEAAELREGSRSLMAEGLMLKRKDSTYQVGRKRGDWWKWKVDPMSIDAVMIYAMRGHGRRANLYTDYTFGVWQGEKLVPFAKAYSGLTDKEIREVDRFVKKNTIDRFGPVRSVTAELVFEIGFEGIAPSTRHQSGIALRFPRILRWRKDKPVNEANTLEDLKGLLDAYSNGES